MWNSTVKVIQYRADLMRLLITHHRLTGCVHAQGPLSSLSLGGIFLLAKVSAVLVLPAGLELVSMQLYIKIYGSDLPLCAKPLSGS